MLNIILQSACAFHTCSAATHFGCSEGGSTGVSAGAGGAGVIALAISRDENRFAIVVIGFVATDETSNGRVSALGVARSIFLVVTSN